MYSERPLEQAEKQGEERGRGKVPLSPYRSQALLASCALNFHHLMLKGVFAKNERGIGLMR